jgi:hypothetical protein
LILAVVLRAVFRQFIQTATRCPEDLRRAKTTVWTRVLVVIDDLLELPLIVIVLYLSVIIKASPHLVILLLAGQRWCALETGSLRIVVLGRSCSLVRLVVYLACVAACELLVSKLGVQLWAVLGYLQAVGAVLVRLGIVARVLTGTVMAQPRVVLVACGHLGSALRV